MPYRGNATGRRSAWVEPAVRRAFVAGHAFYPDPAGESELRLCFSSVLPDAIDQAVVRLARSFSDVIGGAAARPLRKLASSA